MACDRRIRVSLVAFPKIDVHLHFDTTERHVRRIVRVKSAAASGFKCVIDSTGSVGDFEFGATDESDDIGFTTAKVIVIGSASRDLAVGQTNPRIGGRR
ncbi:hypothetical protein D3C84_1115080 [compost metagenome]